MDSYYSNKKFYGGSYRHSTPLSSIGEGKHDTNYIGITINDQDDGQTVHHRHSLNVLPPPAANASSTSSSLSPPASSAKEKLARHTSLTLNTHLSPPKLSLADRSMLYDGPKSATLPTHRSSLSTLGPSPPPHATLSSSAWKRQSASASIVDDTPRSAFRKPRPRRSEFDNSQQPSSSALKPLARLTTYLNQTYQQCNHGFQYNASKNPRRVLTKPSKACSNDGYDNEEFDYILYVNDILGASDGHRYVILDVLGAGTFGQVVKCRNVKTQELFAIKVVKNKLAYFKQSMMEVTILEMLNQRYDPDDQHHILRLKDTFIHREHLCLVFELMSVNLYELIKQNQFRGLSTNLVRVLTAQMLDALTVLNEARIIHCDLKPENVLLRTLESPSIKVIDFGSACHELQTMYTYIQSRFYRSPEVLVGLPYTSAIDMWSLGCIAAELFLGLPLFPGSSEYNQVSRIVEMMGLPPAYMIEMGKNSHRYFDRHVDETGHKHYRLRSLEQYAMEQGKHEQPSKRYFSATTLPELINTYPVFRKESMTTKELDKEKQNRLALIDFLQGLLNLNHFERWSPQQAKQHPFITGEPFTGPFKPPFIPRAQSSIKLPPPVPPHFPHQQQQDGNTTHTSPDLHKQKQRQSMLASLMSSSSSSSSSASASASALSSSSSAAPAMAANASNRHQQQAQQQQMPPLPMQHQSQYLAPDMYHHAAAAQAAAAAAAAQVAAHAATQQGASASYLHPAYSSLPDHYNQPMPHPDFFSRPEDLFLHDKNIHLHVAAPIHTNGSSTASTAATAATDASAKRVSYTLPPNNRMEIPSLASQVPPPQHPLPSNMADTHLTPFSSNPAAATSSSSLSSSPADQSSSFLMQLPRNQQQTPYAVVIPPVDDVNASSSPPAKAAATLTAPTTTTTTTATTTATTTTRPRANTVGTMLIPPPIQVATLDAVSSNKEGKKLGSIRESSRLNRSELDDASESSTLPPAQSLPPPQGYFQPIATTMSQLHTPVTSTTTIPSSYPSSSIATRPMDIRYAPQPMQPPMQHQNQNYHHHHHQQQQQQQPPPPFHHPLHHAPPSIPLHHHPAPHHAHHHRSMESLLPFSPPSASQLPPPVPPLPLHVQQQQQHQQQQQQQQQQLQPQPRQRTTRTPVASTWRASLSSMPPPPIDLERDADWTEERISPTTSLSPFPSSPPSDHTSPLMIRAVMDDQARTNPSLSPSRDNATSPLASGMANMTLQRSTSTSARTTRHNHKRSHSSVRFSEIAPPPSPSLMSRVGNVASLHRRVRGHPPLNQSYHRQDIEWDGFHPAAAHHPTTPQHQLSFNVELE
ncbi:hypothetical protein BC940DRAFT_29875 [Gongronella butleri]|nr:hypothetical protein BC940DRAFT_29875 [Gongronella butleri]